MLIKTNFRRFNSFIWTKTIVAVAALLTCVSAAQADGTLSSDFVLQLDNSVFEAPQFELKKILSADGLKVQLPDMVVQNLLPVYVSGVSFSLNYKFETAADYPLLGTEVAAASTDFSGTLNIAKVHVNGDVREVHDGIEVIGHLNATCTDVKIELLPGKAKALGSILVQVDENGMPTLSVPWFDVSWLEDAWAVTSVSCTGAEGFDHKLKAELIKYLKSSASFAPQFKSFIEKTAADYQALLRDTFSQPFELPLGIRGVKSYLHAGKIEALRGDRFQLRGVVDFVFSSSSYNQSVKLSEKATLPIQRGFSLALPNGFISALSDMSYRAGFQKMTELGSTMKAFRDFRENGFEVSVAWPELGWYPKEMDFRFDFKTSTQPKFSALKGNGSGALIGDLTGNLNVDVWAQEFTAQMKYHKFGHFLSPLSAQYTLSIVSDSAGVPSLQLTFASLTMPLTYVWDPGYTAKNPAVATDLIGDQIRDALLASPNTFALGTFEVHENLKFKPSALRQLGSWLLLDFKK